MCRPCFSVSLCLIIYRITILLERQLLLWFLFGCQAVSQSVMSPHYGNFITSCKSFSLTWNSYPDQRSTLLSVSLFLNRQSWWVSFLLSLVQDGFHHQLYVIKSGLQVYIAEQDLAHLYLFGYRMYAAIAGSFGWFCLFVFVLLVCLFFLFEYVTQVFIDTHYYACRQTVTLNKKCSLKYSS